MDGHDFLRSLLSPTATPPPRPAPGPPRPRRQASTPTATPTATQPPRPTVNLAASSGNYMPPTAPVNTVPSAAEQAYTNPLIPPETRQQRTTTDTILPPYTPPLAQRQPPNNTDFITQHIGEIRAVAAARGVTSEAGAYQIAVELARKYGKPNSFVSPTAPATPKAAAALAITANNADPLNEAPAMSDDKKKTLLIVAVVAVVIVLLVKE